MRNLKVIILITLYSFHGFSQESTTSNLKVHQFDFWISEWNVYEFGTENVKGISTIKPILNHKTIEENYQIIKYKYKGKCLDIYNTRTDKWEKCLMGIIKKENKSNP